MRDKSSDTGIDTDTDKGTGKGTGIMTGEGAEADADADAEGGSRMSAESGGGCVRQGEATIGMKEEVRTGDGDEVGRRGEEKEANEKAELKDGGRGDEDRVPVFELV